MGADIRIDNSRRLQYSETPHFGNLAIPGRGNALIGNEQQFYLSWEKLQVIVILNKSHNVRCCRFHS